jgi:hypothetical protein
MSEQTNTNTSSDAGIKRRVIANTVLRYLRAKGIANLAIENEEVVLTSGDDLFSAINVMMTMIHEPEMWPHGLEAEHAREALRKALVAAANVILNGSPLAPGETFEWTEDRTGWVRYQNGQPPEQNSVDPRLVLWRNIGILEEIARTVQRDQTDEDQTTD